MAPVRYSVTPRIGLKVLREWADARYRGLMLVAMFIELALLGVLVMLEAWGLVHR
jgi:hypothetical protein